MFQRSVGIDLGTANVLVYVKGKGIVLREPSVVALGVSDHKIVAVGNQAYEMLGRVPDSITVIRPMRDGVIADYMVTEAMLRYFIRKVSPLFQFSKPQVMICIPAGVTSVEQRAVRDAAEQAGARRPAYLIPEPLAAAIGAGVPIASPAGHLVVDIGGGTTEAAVISMYGMVVSRSVRVAGNRIDDAIAGYVKRKHNLLIGERTAETIKIEIGSATQLPSELHLEIRGRDQVSGLPKTIEIRSTEVTQAISESLGAITATVRGVLEQTPPELASDIIDRGMILTGGGALLRNFNHLLTEVTGVPCHVAETPLDSVAIGAGLAFDHLDHIWRNLPMEDRSLATMSG